ncbi:MAG TPA: hypothetical protein GXX19_08950 [Syntrophomonadaceae bacterium]|nr:hypothetical protein [Syntrophomonadaceae bacterium]
MPSIYLSASNQFGNVGADGVSEGERMHRLADDIAGLLRKQGIVVFRNEKHLTPWGITCDSNTKKPDLHVALHSNSSDNAHRGQASGTETWTYRLAGTDSARFGALLQKKIVGALGLPDRGLKDATVPGCRWDEVYRTKATAVLTEIFFHDNPRDIARFKERYQDVVVALAEAIGDWFGIEIKKGEPSMGKGEPRTGEGPFKDLDPNRYSTRSILKLCKAGILHGCDDGTFRPEEPLTREQFAVAIDCMMEYLEKVLGVTL